jgi:hypothetical protein
MGFRMQILAARSDALAGEHGTELWTCAQAMFYLESYGHTVIKRIMSPHDYRTQVCLLKAVSFSEAPVGLAYRRVDKQSYAFGHKQRSSWSGSFVET